MLEFMNIRKSIFLYKISHGLIIREYNICVKKIRIIFMVNGNRITRPHY